MVWRSNRNSCISSSKSHICIYINIINSYNIYIYICIISFNLWSQSPCRQCPWRLFLGMHTVALLTSQNLLVPSFCNPQTSLGLVGLGVQTTLRRVAACSAWYAPEDVNVWQHGNVPLGQRVFVDVFSSQLLKHAQFNIAMVGLGDSGTNTIQGGLREPSEKGVGMCMHI